MSGFTFCGNCRVSRDEEERTARDSYRRRQAYEPQDESPFWRPQTWCPDDAEGGLDAASLSGGEASLQSRWRRQDNGFVEMPEDGGGLGGESTLAVEGVKRRKQESAATRIQAHVRGRRTRINHRISVMSFESAAPSEIGADIDHQACSGGASASSRRTRHISFAGENESRPTTSTVNGAAVRSGAAGAQAIPAKRGVAGITTCRSGHRLKEPSRCAHAQKRRCESCKRCFLGEAMMWSCKKCNYFLCQACASSGPCCGDGLKPGARVQLCGMNNQLLNCMNGYVQGRADRNRYTVLISELGDTITLPAQNIEQRAAAGDSGDDGSGSETSGSEVFDANNPESEQPKKRRTITQQALRSIRMKSTAVMSRVSRVAKSIAGAGIMGGMAEMAEMVAPPESSMPLLQAWWDEKKRLAKEQLLEVSAPMRKRMLENIGEFVKDSAMRDPDMWTWVRPIVKSAVSGIWDDIEVEIESNIEVALTDQRSQMDLHTAASVTPGPVFRSRALNRWGACYLRLRAFLLYHYLPYDKTFFGKMKDPVYDFLVALTMLPLFGVRFFFFSVLLFMLITPGPADEYQLVNYILHFKGTMFFTSGVIALFIGAMEYNRCYLFFMEDIRGCIESSGPGANEWLCTLVVDYLGSITLVWIAWLVLPTSRKFPSHVESLRGWSRKEEERSSYCCCLEGVVSRGGRLGGLLSYDVCCFLLSFLAMSSFFWATTDAGDSDFGSDVANSWWNRAKSVTYWCQVLYALFSLPFALFVVPVFSWLLTHSTFTGYNCFGACVEFAFDAAEEKEATEEPGGSAV